MRLHHLLAAALLTPFASAQDPQPTEALETRIEQLEQQLEVVLEELADSTTTSNTSIGGSADSGFSFGGYGEGHANFRQSSDRDYLDLHRFVFYLGYQFNDWIQLSSETEIEHAYVDDDDGYLMIEQLHVDFSVAPAFNIRAGRHLVPVGITNKVHEPNTFYSVERPSVEKYVIPSTWSQDGVGVYGRLNDHVEYEIYVGGGMDGSGFNATDGIRGGRLKERPGTHEPAVTGRLDFYPMAGDPDHDLRIGASFYTSGLDNANQGTSSAPGRVTLVSADVQYRRGDFEARGVYAQGKIDDVEQLNAAFGEDVGEEQVGYYIEAAYHFMPDAWKTGRLDRANAVVFARFEDYDTQHEVPAGVTKDPDAAREEITAGVAFFFTEELVIKVDYSIRDEQDDLFNLGIGWSF